MVEAQDGAAPEKPVRTWRPMALWSLAILAALALLWLAATVVELRETAAIVKRYADPFDVAVNRAAVERLGGPNHALQRIELYLRLPPRLARYREWAPLVLSGCGRRAVPVLIKHLTSDPDDKVRQYAAWGLGLIGPEARDAIPVLIAALNDTGDSVPEGAARALWQVGSQDVTAIPLLIKLVSHQSPDAAYALGAIGPAAKDAVPALAKAIKPEGGTPSESAAEALGDIGDPGAIEPLIIALKTPNPFLRVKVAEALAKLEDRRGLETLKHLLTDANALARLYAAEAVGRIGPQARDAEQALIELLPDFRAAEALRKIRGESK